MTAQARGPLRPSPPRMTIRDIRAALPSSEHGRFDAEIEGHDWTEDLNGFREALKHWRMVAVAQADGRAEASLKKARNVGYTLPQGAVRLEDLVEARAAR